MTKKELMVKAHKMTKEIKTQYPGVDYKFQLGLCLAYLQKEGENEMVSYKTEKGTSVEVKVEGKEITDLTVNGIEVLKNSFGGTDCYLTRGFIVINSRNLYKKLGANSQIKIAMNEELNNLYNRETEKVKVELNKDIEDMDRRKSKDDEYYANSFYKHMKDRNGF